jgi:uncharacterized protein
MATTALISEDKGRISLERCPNLTIISDTPKGMLFSLRSQSARDRTNFAGRGVFATKRIAAKEVIDVCPVLVLGLEENVEHIEHTSLYHYT